MAFGGFCLSLFSSKSTVTHALFMSRISFLFRAVVTFALAKLLVAQLTVKLPASLVILKIPRYFSKISIESFHESFVYHLT